MNRLDDYIGHIVAAVDRIFGYVRGLTQVEFLATPLVQDAVIRNIEIIGRDVSALLPPVAKR